MLKVETLGKARIKTNQPNKQTKQGEYKKLEVEGVSGVLFQVSEAGELLPQCRRVLWSGGLSLASSLRADPKMLIARLREHALLVRNEPAYARRTMTAAQGGGWLGNRGGRAASRGCLHPSPTNTTINQALSQEATPGCASQNRVRIRAAPYPRDMLTVLTPLQLLSPQRPSSCPIPSHSQAHRDPHSSSTHPESPSPPRSGAWSPPWGCDRTLACRDHC